MARRTHKKDKVCNKLYNTRRNIYEQLSSNTYNSEALSVFKYLHRKKVVKNARAEKDL